MFPIFKQMLENRRTRNQKARHAQGNSPPPELDSQDTTLIVLENLFSCQSTPHWSLGNTLPFCILRRFSGVLESNIAFYNIFLCIIMMPQGCLLYCRCILTILFHTGLLIEPKLRPWSSKQYNNLQNYTYASVFTFASLLCHAQCSRAFTALSIMTRRVREHSWLCICSPLDPTFWNTCGWRLGEKMLGWYNCKLEKLTEHPYICLWILSLQFFSY